MGLDRASGFGIDRPAEADADAFNLIHFEPAFRERLANAVGKLRPDSLGAFGWIDLQSDDVADEDAVAGADADLQFGTADFDADEHEGGPFVAAVFRVFFGIGKKAGLG